VSGPTWKEVPMGGVIAKGGTAFQYPTGDWRNIRPVHDRKLCINCMRCWLYCPDASIQVKEGKVVGIDYDHCKGCGICSTECPTKPKAIKMFNESEFEE
jgi:pyruvate ferredoxin oxidoreductase delta subunit